MAHMPRLATLIVLGALCWATPGRAEEAAEQPGDRTGPPAAVQGVVEDLAGQLGRLIADLPRPRMDLAIVVSSELPGPPEGRPQSLSQALQELLLGTLSRDEPLRSVRGREGAAWADRERARASAAAEGFELLLWLELSSEQNHLLVRGMLYETEQHIWRESVEPERQVIGQLFNRCRINAELRWYLGALPTTPLSLTTIPLGARSYLALAVADLDGDDVNELLLLSRRTLEIHRLNGEATELLARFRLMGVARAATRSRDPVGSLVVAPPGEDGTRHIALRTSDHAQGMVVSYDGTELNLVSTFTDFPIRWDDELECTTLRAGRNAFQTAPAPCRSLGSSSVVSSFFTSVRERIYRPTGPSAVLEGTVRADSSVTLSWDGRRTATIGPFGTALAITDLDDDGGAEVLLSSDIDPWLGDELTVIRFDVAGTDSTREPLGRVGGSVWVAAAGDVDDDGLRELVAIVQMPRAAELLVIE